MNPVDYLGWVRIFGYGLILLGVTMFTLAVVLTLRMRGREEVRDREFRL